eukprot:6017360-Amphidinium_carterae.1
MKCFQEDRLVGTRKAQSLQAGQAHTQAKSSFNGTRYQRCPPNVLHLRLNPRRLTPLAMSCFVQGLCLGSSLPQQYTPMLRCSKGMSMVLKVLQLMFGQVVPRNSVERIFNIACLIFGLVFFSTIISSLSAKLMQWSESFDHVIA